MPWVKLGMYRYRVAAAVAVLLFLAGCNATFDVAVPPDNERVYARLYPYYAELCAVSQIKKKPGFGVDTSGGPGGHSVLYLNGVCRVREAGYPTIALCAPDTPDADEGVGLSVNAHFKNANWVATDGRDFFFRGGMPPDARLTRAAYARTQEEAKAKDIYEGVVFHSVVFDDMPPGWDKRDYMYEVSIGTDYAIGFARDRYCARVPMSRAQMGKAIVYLNGVNAVYKNGQKNFDWNVLENNCTHLVHNALAAAGLWREWETERFVLISAFDFPVPKNEFVNTIWRLNDMDLSDVGSVYRDEAARRSLMEDGALPEEPGGLAVAARAIQENDVYDTDVKLIFYDDPIFGTYQRRFDTIFSEPRYTDIEANLRYFAALYRHVEGERRPLAGAIQGHEDERAQFSAFYRRFYAYIDRESAEVDASLAMLSRPASLAGMQR